MELRSPNGEPHSDAKMDQHFSGHRRMRGLSASPERSPKRRRVDQGSPEYKEEAERRSRHSPSRSVSPLSARECSSCSRSPSPDRRSDDDRRRRRRRSYSRERSRSSSLSPDLRRRQPQARLSVAERDAQERKANLRMVERLVLRPNRFVKNFAIRHAPGFVLWLQQQSQLCLSILNGETPVETLHSSYGDRFVIQATLDKWITQHYTTYATRAPFDRTTLNKVLTLSLSSAVAQVAFYNRAVCQLLPSEPIDEKKMSLAEITQRVFTELEASEDDADDDDGDGLDASAVHANDPYLYLDELLVQTFQILLKPDHKVHNTAFWIRRRRRLMHLLSECTLYTKTAWDRLSHKQPESSKSDGKAAEEGAKKSQTSLDDEEDNDEYEEYDSELDDDYKEDIDKIVNPHLHMHDKPQQGPGLFSAVALEQKKQQQQLQQQHNGEADMEHQAEHASLDVAADAAQSESKSTSSESSDPDDINVLAKMGAILEETGAAAAAVDAEPNGKDEKKQAVPDAKHATSQLPRKRRDAYGDWVDIDADDITNHPVLSEAEMANYKPPSRNLRTLAKRPQFYKSFGNRLIVLTSSSKNEHRISVIYAALEATVRYIAWIGQQLQYLTRYDMAKKTMVPCPVSYMKFPRQQYEHIIGWMKEYMRFKCGLDMYRMFHDFLYGYQLPVFPDIRYHHKNPANRHQLQSKARKFENQTSIKEANKMFEKINNVELNDIYNDPKHPYRNLLLIFLCGYRIGNLYQNDWFKHYMVTSYDFPTRQHILLKRTRYGAHVRRPVVACLLGLWYVFDIDQTAEAKQRRRERAYGDDDDDHDDHEEADGDDFKRADAKDDDAPDEQEPYLKQNIYLCRTVWDMLLIWLTLVRKYHNSEMEEGLPIHSALEEVLLPNDLSMEEATDAV